MSRVDISLPQKRSLGQTSRKDGWWIMPAITIVYFLSFVFYSTWAAFQGNHYYLSQNGSQYLSPFYSPVLFYTDEKMNMFSGEIVPVVGGAPLHHAWLGEWPTWLPLGIFGIIPLTPALFILWAPGGFRFTCYYYRGAYYKAFWGDPVNCAVGEPGFRGDNYRGEAKFPLIFQNIHRYFMYVALVFIGILAYDAFLGFRFTTAEGDTEFGMGVGSIVLLLNVIFLGAYTFGCHSLRHVVGGKNNCVSANPARYQAWKCVTCLNKKHMQWAWISLFWVGFSDLYIRLCSMGVWTDYRFF